MRRRTGIAFLLIGISFDIFCRPQLNLALRLFRRRQLLLRELKNSSAPAELGRHQCEALGLAVERSRPQSQGEREGKRSPNVFKICQFHLFAFHSPSDGFHSGRVRPLSQHYAKRLGVRPLPDNLNILGFSQRN